MKHNFQTIIFLVAIVVTGGSCKKYIYESPITSTNGTRFWTSQSAVEQASLAMYGQLRSCLRDGESHFIFGDIASGSFLPASNNSNFQVKASTSPPFNFSYVPYKEGELQNWSRFYQLIAQTNLVLQNVPQMQPGLFTSESVKNAYIAEALFMRAYTYFYMTRVWGDPVFVTQTYNDVDYGNIPPIARTAESIVLDSCIKDLKTAAPYLNYSGGDKSKTIRANKGSVYSLLAHIYAWKRQYDSVHVYAQEVIKNGGYAPEPMATYANIWKGQLSTENIFELSMLYNANDPKFALQADNEQPWAEAQFDFFGVFLKGPVVANIRNSCWVSPTGGMVDDFYAITDARYKTILTPVPISGGDMAGYMLLKYTNFQFQKPGALVNTGTLPYLNNNLVLFRLSDIILLDAEALAFKGDLAGAAAALSITEKRAGITSYLKPVSQYDMIDEVVMERGRELIGEGTWYYDLIRTEPTQGWLVYMGYPTDRVNPTNKGYYWPLDLSTLFPQDNLLTQNPWWATHK